MNTLIYMGLLCLSSFMTLNTPIPTVLSSADAATVYGITHDSLDEQSILPKEQCDQVWVEANYGQIEFCNFKDSKMAIKVFKSGWSPIFTCFNNCSQPSLIIDSLQAGNYFVELTYFNEQLKKVCRTDSRIVLATSKENLVPSD